MMDTHSEKILELKNGLTKIHNKYAPIFKEIGQNFPDNNYAKKTLSENFSNFYMVVAVASENDPLPSYIKSVVGQVLRLFQNFIEECSGKKHPQYGEALKHMVKMNNEFSILIVDFCDENSISFPKRKSPDEFYKCLKTLSAENSNFVQVELINYFKRSNDNLFDTNFLRYDFRALESILENLNCNFHEQIELFKELLSEYLSLYPLVYDLHSVILSSPNGSLLTWIESIQQSKKAIPNRFFEIGSKLNSLKNEFLQGRPNQEEFYLIARKIDEFWFFSKDTNFIRWDIDLDTYAQDMVSNIVTPEERDVDLYWGRIYATMLNTVGFQLANLQFSYMVSHEEDKHSVIGGVSNLFDYALIEFSNKISFALAAKERFDDLQKGDIGIFIARIFSKVSVNKSNPVASLINFAAIQAKIIMDAKEWLEDKATEYGMSQEQLWNIIREAPEDESGSILSFVLGKIPFFVKHSNLRIEFKKDFLRHIKDRLETRTEEAREAFNVFETEIHKVINKEGIKGVYSR